jgi:hypothetical protein
MPEERKPDWKALVRERLSLAELSPAQQEETIAELASHLADLCREYRVQGISESEAVRRATDEVTDWRSLAETIQRAKREEETMNDRTKRLWLPGLVSTAIALVLPIALLMVLKRIGITLPSHSHFVSFLWPLDLILGGAGGAYLSRLAGGKPMIRLASALFPVAVPLIAIFLVSALVVLAQICFGAYRPMPWLEVARSSVWVVRSLALLLVGALPFLRRQQKLGESGVSHA